MAVMAVAASGRAQVAIAEGDAMHARAVAVRLLRMASRAIRRFCGHIVIGMFAREVRMATGAGVGAMDGRGELRHVHVKRYDTAGGVGLDEGRVVMAVEAFAVLDGL